MSPKYWSKVLFSVTMYRTCLIGDAWPLGGHSTSDTRTPGASHGLILALANLSFSPTCSVQDFTWLFETGRSMPLTEPPSWMVLARVPGLDPSMPTERL